MNPRVTNTCNASSAAVDVDTRQGCGRGRVDTTVTLLQRGSRGSIRTLCYLCVRFIYGVLIGSYADISAGTEHGSTRHRTHNTAVKLVFRLTCRPFFTHGRCSMEGCGAGAVLICVCHTLRGRPLCVECVALPRSVHCILLKLAPSYGSRLAPNASFTSCPASALA